jgi:ubiquinone/menaquinone biosynthesis C-methylase UbiE
MFKNGVLLAAIKPMEARSVDAVEQSMPLGEIVGVDPSEAFVAYAQKSARSTRVRYEVGDAQALKFKDASFDQTLALLVMNFIPDHNRQSPKCAV